MNNIVHIKTQDWERWRDLLTDWVPMIIKGRGIDDVIVGYRPSVLGM